MTEPSKRKRPASGWPKGWEVIGGDVVDYEAALDFDAVILGGTETMGMAAKLAARHGLTACSRCNRTFTDERYDARVGSFSYEPLRAICMGCRSIETYERYKNTTAPKASSSPLRTEKKAFVYSIELINDAP